MKNKLLKFSLITIMGVSVLVFSSPIVLSMVTSPANQSNTYESQDQDTLYKKISHDKETQQEEEHKKKREQLSEQMRKWAELQNNQKSLSEEKANKTEKQQLKALKSDLHSSGAEEYVIKAEDALNNNDIETAYASIREALKLDPSNANIKKMFQEIYRVYSEQIVASRNEIIGGTK
ncbi:hypothetical protein [Paenibacillus sp. OAS669]|uniref:hypothetical protein n=1 Tax=Paenibacillus sp. OAS669 TaxID=2663821 RepID=UPI001789D7F8|nr:hypothetical protein [Paenibacillus sp. OAS669]MBE1442604.1 Flp pilus assembly protein TadD [Paenibacillus sp. OAS669]